MCITEGEREGGCVSQRGEGGWMCITEEGEEREGGCVSQRGEVYHTEGRDTQGKEEVLIKKINIIYLK